MLICRAKYLLKFQNGLVSSRFKHCWIKPDGFETGIKVYNCITKDKQPLILKNKNIVTWYSCGPTVYSSSHVGHASYFVKLDILQKILSHYFKYNVVTVMNITDIDDKIILKANELKKTCVDVATKYEEEFWEDLNSLHVSKPNLILKVTENVSLVINFIKKLENSNKAYKAKDNSVYFDVQNYDNYGKLQNIGDGATEKTENVFKRSRMDFVLWKSTKDGEPFWKSPWGRGRPGWHIECSALASHALGSSIDIHAGGIDLRFPHHENEEAQSCVFHDTRQWVNYWIHTGYLRLKNSEKMSKSLKNTVSIQEMLTSTKPEVFRMACAMSHYRSNMEYSSELIETAENVLMTYKNFLNSCDDFTKGYLKAAINTKILNTLLNDSVCKVQQAFSDDFDTPTVVKVLHKIVSVTNSMLHSSSTPGIDNILSEADLICVMAISNFVVEILSVFGVNLKFEKCAHKSENLTEIINILNNFRQDVRVIAIADANQNILKLCDNVREELRLRGITVKDHGKISSWSR